MAWWNLRRQTPARVPARVERADGVVASVRRYDLTNPTDREALDKLQEQWQQDIVTYADMIGEFKDAGRFIENSFRRIGLFAAYMRDGDEEPVPVGDATERPEGERSTGDPVDVLDDQWAKLADQYMSEFASRDGGQQALMARFGPLLFYIGEALLIQRAVPERAPVEVDGVLERADEIPRVLDWEVRSPFEVRRRQSDRRAMEVIDYPGQKTGEEIVGLNGEEPFVERVWRKHWFWCVDAETRILTRDHGWVSHRDLHLGDVVLTLNHETGISEWQPVQGVHRFDVVDEPMLSIESKFHSSLTTASHRWPTVTLHGGRRSWKRSEDLTTSDRLVLAAPSSDVPTEPKWSDAFVELVAWFWTEGHILQSSGGAQPVHIFQSTAANPAYVARIRSALTSLYGPAHSGRMTTGLGERIGPAWREHTGGDGRTRFTLNHAAAAALIDVAPDRVVRTDFVRRLTSAQLRLFIDTSIDGDGTRSGQYAVVTQASPDRLVGLELACVLAGIVPAWQYRDRPGHGPTWYLTIRSGGAHYTPIRRRGDHRWVPYTGIVWCPTTQNGTWFAQRNGRVFFTGNSGWADSNARAAVDTLEELRLLGLVSRASLRSRAMAGVWTIPEELDFSASDLPDGTPNAAAKAVSFDRTFAEAMTAGISNEADPNTVAPLIVRGASKFLTRDVFGPIEMPRRYAEDERIQREEAVKRLARTVELPQEKMLGVADQNHWSAWLVDEDTYRAYLEPLALVATEGLTFGYLRPLLEAAGCPPEVVDRIVVAPDTSRLVRRADKGKTAGEGYEFDVPAVGSEAWRRVNAFGDDDAPKAEDMILRLLMAGTLDSAAIETLAALGYDVPAEVERLVVERRAAAEEIAGGEGVEGERELPERPDEAPAENTQAVAASVDGSALDAALAALVRRQAQTAALAEDRRVGVRLAGVDAVLFATLVTQSDQAVTRVLERIGARLRSRTRDGEMRSALALARDVPNHELAAHLPVHLVAAAVGPEPVAAEDFDALRARFDRSVDSAQEAAIRELSRLAGDRLTDDRIAALRRDQEQDRDDAWAWLLAALVAYATGRLARAEAVVDDDGEWDPSAVVPPSLVWSAVALAGGTPIEQTAMGGVAHAGGGPAGGIATGDRIRREFAETGFPWASWEWEYGSAPRQTPFEPHLALDGAPDSAWHGYQPKDHKHCKCSAVPIVIGGP